MDNKIDNNYQITNQTNTNVIRNTTTQPAPQTEIPNTVFIAQKDNTNPIKISIRDGGLNIGNDQTNVKFSLGVKGLEDMNNIKLTNIRVTFDSAEVRQKINSDLTVWLGYKKGANNVETYTVGCKWVF